jgi:hypothetical protein
MAREASPLTTRIMNWIGNLSMVSSAAGGAAALLTASSTGTGQSVLGTLTSLEGPLLSRVLTVGMTALGIGTAGLITKCVFDRVQDPVWKYDDPDGVVKVTPASNSAMQRFSKTFGVYADFDAGTVCDVNISEENFTVRRSFGGGIATTFESLALSNESTSKYEKMSYTNKRSFNEVSDPAMRARIERLRQYAEQARAKFRGSDAASSMKTTA